MEIIFSSTEQALISAVKALKQAGLPAPELPAHLQRDYALEVEDTLVAFNRLALTPAQADSLINELRKLLARYSAPADAGGGGGTSAGGGSRGGRGGNDERRKTLIDLLTSGSMLYIKSLPLSYDRAADEFIAGIYRARSISGLAKLITNTSVNGWTLVTDQNGKKVF